MPFGYKSVHCIIIMVKSDIPKYVFTSVAAVTSVGGGGKSTCQNKYHSHTYILDATCKSAANIRRPTADFHCDTHSHHG